MQKKLSLSLIILSVIYVVSGVLFSVSAEDEPIIEVADQALKLELGIANQTYPDKSIVLKLTINPEIDIPRGAVTWNYDDTLFSLKAGEAQDVVALKAGQTATLYKTFAPSTQYKFNPNTEFDFSVKVSGTAYDKNYLSVKGMSLSLNSEYEVVPLLADYNQQKAIINSFYLVLGVIGTGLLIVLITKGVQRFRAYLNSD